MLEERKAMKKTYREPREEGKAEPANIGKIVLMLPNNEYGKNAFTLFTKTLDANNGIGFGSILNQYLTNGGDFIIMIDETMKESEQAK